VETAGASSIDMRKTSIHFARHGSFVAIVWLAATAQAIGASASQPQPIPSPTAGPPLTGVYWKAIELMGKPAPIESAPREAHLQFEPDGRFAGSDGCNRTSGTYALAGDKLTFGAMLATRMACVNAAGTEQLFREAIEKTRGWRLVGERLEFVDANAVRVAVFEARPQTPR
jgi:heat shock protein HslJ